MLSPFGTATIGVSQSLWSTFCIIPSFSRHSNSFSTFSFKAYGTGLAMQNLLCAVSFKVKVAFTPLTFPDCSEKTDFFAKYPEGFHL